MTKEEVAQLTPVFLDLTEINGNAFSLMGAFSKAASRQGWTKDAITFVLDEAKSSNYDHLVQTLLTYTTMDEDAPTLPPKPSKVPPKPMVPPKQMPGVSLGL